MRRISAISILVFLFSASSALAQEHPPCPAGEHWDEGMQMCMPDTGSDHHCPAGQHWDESMQMCMPDAKKPKTTAMVHANGFLVGSTTSGPRGRSAIYSPNMVMGMVDHDLSEKSAVHLNVMLSSERWTVPKNGTPQVLQAGETRTDGSQYIDAQHPHPAIMGVEGSYSRVVGTASEGKLTLLFAPRGEATAGPPAFMHRASAEGNPNVPLSHHVGQDVFHITSTVAGARYTDAKSTVAMSAFSGKEPLPNALGVDMHQPDSFGVLVSRFITPKVQAGASFANVRAAHQDLARVAEAAEKEQSTAVWIATDHAVRSGSLSTSTIFGQIANRNTSTTLRSFLEEFSYRLKKDSFFGRVEVLQRTPEQLEIQVTDAATGARWVKAITLGYERKVAERGDLRVYTGGSVTKSMMPADFTSHYGGHPNQLELHMRVNWKGSRSSAAR